MNDHTEHSERAELIRKLNETAEQQLRCHYPIFGSVGLMRQAAALLDADKAGGEPDDVVKDALLDAMNHVKLILESANNDPIGPIIDTIWASPHETLFDFIEASIDAAMLKDKRHE